MSAWDPSLYLKYANERARPAADLIARIRLESPKNIVDLGCGPGNSTEQLKQRWPNANITGVDSSPEMLAKAKAGHPDWRWVLCDIESWHPEQPADLIFSNAAFHWIPGHGTLFRGMMNHVAGGGVLAAQMPNNFQSAAHTVIKEVALKGDPRWKNVMESAVGALDVQPPAFYYDVLRKHASQLDIWETEYQHIMDGPRAILDWIRSTAMRPYLDRLPDAEQRRLFEAMCLEGLQEAYRTNDQGKVLFPYRRIFIVAYK